MSRNASPVPTRPSTDTASERPQLERRSRAGRPGRTAGSRSWPGRACGAITAERAVARLQRQRRCGRRGRSRRWPARTRATPHAADEPSSRLGQADQRRCRRSRRATPSELRSRGAAAGTAATPNSAVNIGVAPLSSPVTAELMCCSAIGNSVNGRPDPEHRHAQHPAAGPPARCGPAAPGSSVQDDRAQARRAASVTTPGSHRLEADRDEQERAAPDPRDRREDAASRSAVNAAPGPETVRDREPRSGGRVGEQARATRWAVVGLPGVGARGPGREAIWSHASKLSASSRAATVTSASVRSAARRRRPAGSRCTQVLPGQLEHRAEPAGVGGGPEGGAPDRGHGRGRGGRGRLDEGVDPRRRGARRPGRRRRGARLRSSCRVAASECSVSTSSKMRKIERSDTPERSATCWAVGRATPSSRRSSSASTAWSRLRSAGPAAVDGGSSRRRRWDRTARPGIGVALMGVRA